MKNKMLVDEFIDLIDGYKIDKITKLITGDSQSKNPNTKMGVKGFLGSLNTENKDRSEVSYMNALEPIDLNKVESLLSDIYPFDFSEDFQEWLDYQNSEEYKSQVLRTKIANKVKKEIKNQDTKEEVKRILNQYKLAYDLDSSLIKH